MRDSLMDGPETEQYIYVLPKPEYFTQGACGRVSHALGVTAGLAASGVRVTLVSGPGVRPFVDQLSQKDSIEVVEVDDAWGRGWRGRRLWRRELLKELRKVAKAQGSHCTIIVRYSVSNAPMLARWIRAVPAQRWVVEINSLAYHQLATLPSWLRAVILRLESWLLRPADALYVVSRSLRHDILSVLGSSWTDRVLWVPNGGNRLEARPHAPAMRHRDGEARFVYFGVLHAYYDFSVVAHAFRAVQHDIPDAKLDIYGSGSESFGSQSATAYLRRLFEGMPGVTFHGRFDRSSLTAELQRIRPILLLPLAGVRRIPINRIGSPIKLYEYMALAMPIIAARVGEVPETLRDGEAGLLYDPGSAEELADRMRFAVRNRDVCDEMGRRARELLETAYTWEHRMRSLRDKLANVRSPRERTP